MLDQPRDHVMVLDSTHETGVEEWFCPECGRRVLIQWDPNFSLTVLEIGDECSPHTGAKGGLSIHNTQARSSDELGEADEETPHEELKLGPWEEWFKKVNFDDLWNESK